MPFFTEVLLQGEVLTAVRSEAISHPFRCWEVGVLGQGVALSSEPLHTCTTPNSAVQDGTGCPTIFSNYNFDLSVVARADVPVRVD